MAMSRGARWGVGALVGLLVLGAGAVVGFRVAVRALKGKVVEALGPDSEIQDLRVGWSAVEVVGLRLKGPRGWPAADTLRADRVVIVPSLRSLLSDTIQVRSVTVTRPYLSALRAKDGRLRVVPSLLEGRAAAGKTAAAGPPARAVAIGRIMLEDGVLELFDATVAAPPLKVRLEQIQATVHEVMAPALLGRSRFDLTAVVKGLRRDGRATLSGWAEVATKDSSVKTQLRSVDLVALQPYLARAGEVRLRRGALDLDIQSDVRQRRLKAPGRVVISDLEFAPAAGALDTFMGVPRAAVVNFLKNRENAIEVRFTLEGDIDNPQFALNEAFATRIASSMAENLGVSLRGVAEGAGGLGRKGVEALGDAARGVSGALRGLLGGTKKP